MTDNTFPGFVVTKDRQGTVRGAVTQITEAELPDGEVLIRVAYSSLNYKDAMVTTGHPGIVREFPHVPGIDLAGSVVQSNSKDFATDELVLVTGYGLVSSQWGGWSGLVRVPSEWVVRLPDGLPLQEAMALGTAGFTAAQCVTSLQLHQVDANSGPVVVTGASGGVGSIAVAILAQLGYDVIAVTGKTDAHALLKKIGASKIIPRHEVADSSEKPLLESRWAGAVDTVGGKTLSTLVRSTGYRGCVTACGLVGGVDCALTVYPFLLRGVTLDGIDSASCPMPQRLELWERLAGPWRPERLSDLMTTIRLSQLNDKISQMLEGSVVGRSVVDLREK